MWNNILDNLGKILLKLVWPVFAFFLVWLVENNILFVVPTFSSHYASIRLAAQKSGLFTILLYLPKKSVYTTSTFHFITLCFIGLHRCFIFYKPKAKPSTSKEIMTLFIVIPTLFQWSGIKPAISPRCAWIHVNEKRDLLSLQDELYFVCMWENQGIK